MRFFTTLPPRLALAVAGLLALAAGGLVGVADHLPGIALWYAAAVLLTLAAVLRWRPAALWFRMAALTAAAFVVLVVAHNAAEAAAHAVASPALLVDLLELVSVAAFLLAVFGCPAALVVSLAGGFVLLSREKDGDGNRSPR